MTTERTCVNLSCLAPSVVNAFHRISPLEQQNLSSKVEFGVSIGARTRHRLNAWWLHGISSYSFPSCQAISTPRPTDLLSLYWNDLKAWVCSPLWTFPIGQQSLCVCACCPPFFKAPRFALCGGLDKYVSPAPQAAPKDLVVIYSCGSTWGGLFRGPPVPS